MKLEIFAFPPSPRAFKVLALANHLGLDHELHFVDLIKGEQKTPDYVALNPNMRMPTLRHGDYVLWESEAILQYLALQKPESRLLPTEEKARLDVTRWQFWDLAHWDPSCAVFIFEYFVKPALLGINEPDRAALDKVQEPFHRAAKVLDGQLKGKTFLTGEQLTVADFALGAPLNLAAAARIPFEPYAEIRRWFDTLRALPAWQRTLAQSAPPAAHAA